MTRAILVGLAATFLLLSPSIADAKGFQVKKVKGDLTAAEEDTDLKGRFSLLALTSGDKGFEKLYVLVKGLDSEEEYEVLLGEDIDGAVSFGEMTVRGKKGFGRFKFSSRKHDYPEDVDSLVDFSGETIFVVSGDTVVMEGDIPAFAGLGDEEVAEGSVAFGFGKEKLSPPEDDDSYAFGFVYAGAVSAYKGSREWLSVVVFLLEKGAEYDVVLVGEDGADDEVLGTIKARGFLGFGALTLDTGAEDELPDHPADLEGREIEVQDVDGNVVLTGKIPALD